MTKQVHDNSCPDPDEVNHRRPGRPRKLKSKKLTAELKERRREQWRQARKKFCKKRQMEKL